MNHSTNISRQQYRISRKERSDSLQQHPLILWFTGLSGSGKSTLADLVEQGLYERHVHTMLLDGDNIRHGLNSNIDFSPDGRKENIRRIGEVSRLFLDAGIVVITAFISPYREDRDMVRKLAGEDFVEIFVDCPLEICEQRDTKGLYKKARAGEIAEFTGISAPFEIPENPDITVRTAEEDAETSARKILNMVLQRIKKSKE
jgi:adenylylsulfate kinase